LFPNCSPEPRRRATLACLETVTVQWVGSGEQGRGAAAAVGGERVGEVGV
jgi:hypothetical protein